MSNIHCSCFQGKMKTDEREMTATSKAPPVVRVNGEKNHLIDLLLIFKYAKRDADIPKGYSNSLVNDKLSMLLEKILKYK